MSSRVTRSNARNSAGSSNPDPNSLRPPPPPTDHQLPPPPSSSVRKRKANAGGSSPEHATNSPESTHPRRSKRTRVDLSAPNLPEPSSPRNKKGKAAAAMSDQDGNLTGGPSEEPPIGSTIPVPSSSSKRKSSRKRAGHGWSSDKDNVTHIADVNLAGAPSSTTERTEQRAGPNEVEALLDALVESNASDPMMPPSEWRNQGPRIIADLAGRKTDIAPDPTTFGTSQAPSRHSKKSSRPNQSNLGRHSHDKSSSRAGKSDGQVDLQDDDSDGDESNEEDGRKRMDHDDEDPFGRGFPGRYAGSSLSGSIRALSGFMSGQSSRLRNILEHLKETDPSEQLIVLQEFSELLLISTEDNLAGQFTPDPYIKELVRLMKPSETGEESPEIMLLACRCIANMMEALPSSTANVVYSGAVPVLCEKLLEIHYIDVAEQALITLEKISVEFPSMIVENGGLAACLQYLDFFATSNQRTAVTTAANCCRNLAESHFYTVKEVMPVLLGVLGNSDQKVLEQGCLCVSRIVESYKFNEEKLEELVDEELLKAILRLLLPGTTNLISANIHTQFLRVLAFTARASPRRAVELFKMNVVDTIYQILTGVSPPSGSDDAVAAKIDSVIIMQALIHRPRDQIFETLNVICELLPLVQDDGLLYTDFLFDAGYPGDFIPLIPSKKSTNDKRVKSLEDCKEELKRFTIILLPTLTDVFSSTVNLSVRQKVLTAQLKMLSNVDVDILEEALRNVSYSSFLASILSQQDHPTLVTFALQAAELLIKRMEPIYRYQFYREGVISEIAKLADRPMKETEQEDVDMSMSLDRSESPDEADVDLIDHNGDIDIEREDDEDEHDDNDEEEEEEDDDNDDNEDAREHRDDTSSSPSHSPPGRSFPPARLSIPDPQDLITRRAKRFIESYEPGPDPKVRKQADSIMKDLTHLTEDIERCFSSDQHKNGLSLFRRLATHFDQDTLENITSYELLTSNVVNVLLETLGDSNPFAADARTCFLEAFMGEGTQTKQKSSVSASPATPFSILVHKLQDLLSRAEHFEVITVHHHAFDSSRSSAASMLAKQIRLRLTADDESGLPRTFRNIQVSIHAIATFKALDEYLRQRITLLDRPRPDHRSRMHMLSALMAERRLARDSMRSPLPLPGALPPPPQDLTNRIPKRGDRNKTTSSTTPAQASSSATAASAPSVRRSSRRHQPQNPAPVATPPTLGRQDEVKDPIECADEAHLSDGDEPSESGAVEALNAVLDRLDDGSPSDEEDPQAVNMEVASTGKVTARKDDGTRIATPMGSQVPPSRSASASHLTSSRTPAAAPTPSGGRALSYASALQTTPQDWHLEFSYNGQPIPSDMTVYRFVHFNQTESTEVSLRNLWSGAHTVHFKRVSGPPTESNTLSPAPENTADDGSDVPASIARNPTTASILQLLSLLHSLNSNIDDVISEKKESIKLVSEPSSQFVNTKLTAKLNRQLEEPLIVASNCLPSWSEDLARLYPFLFPFETRHLFLQSTSFGYSRSMTRWQNTQTSDNTRHDRHRDVHQFLGRLQRQKVRISRNDILKSAVKVMDLYGASPSVLEVEYFEEVGTGLGPTLEFYSSVSKEFAKRKLKMWRENESSDTSDYAFGAHGLFPAPMSAEQASADNGKKILSLFKSLGKFVARSMLDSRIIDVSFNTTLFRVTGRDGSFKPSLAAVRSVDNDLANSLKVLKKFANAKQEIDENPRLTPMQKVQKITRLTVDNASIEDLALDFTLPGYPNIELIAGGADTAVTIDNVAQYIDLVIDFTLGSGVARQLQEFRTGFSSVFPYTALHAFTPSELVMLFGRNEEDWSLETLMDSIKADHGFNLDSRSVRNLLQVMSEFSLQERRDFLQFVTGSPKLPIGGFKALTPMFTVVCKPSEAPYTSDDYLPSVMTCVNYLKLPDYSSIEVMKAKLSVAIKEGQGAFHLS